MQLLRASADDQGRVAPAIHPSQAAQLQPTQLQLVPIGQLRHSYQVSGTRQEASRSSPALKFPQVAHLVPLLIAACENQNASPLFSPPPPHPHPHGLPNTLRPLHVYPSLSLVEPHSASSATHSTLPSMS